MPGVEVRLLKSIAEYRQCERIQRRVWGAAAVTSAIMSAMQKHGGSSIGTIVDGKVVGFILAFLARYHSHHLVHWSHFTAAEAKYRDQGFGFRMKLVYRQIALEQGLESICWTFDPLRSRNARLNISRLGGDRGAAEQPITGTLKASERSTT